TLWAASVDGDPSAAAGRGAAEAAGTPPERAPTQNQTSPATTAPTITTAPKATGSSPARMRSHKTRRRSGMAPSPRARRQRPEEAGGGRTAARRLEEARGR